MLGGMYVDLSGMMRPTMKVGFRCVGLGKLREAAGLGFYRNMRMPYCRENTKVWFRGIAMRSLFNRSRSGGWMIP